MVIRIEIDETDLKELLLAHLQQKMPEADIILDNINIQVRSKQNYKAEWEIAAFRAIVQNTA